MMAMDIPAAILYNMLMTAEIPLTFLATTRQPRCTIRLDKRLDGYHTMQFMERGSVWLAYDDREYTLTGPWFWPAYPGPRLRFQAGPGHDHWFHRHVGFQGPLVSRWVAMGLWPEGPQPAPPGRDYAAFFDALIAQARRGDHWGRRRAVNLLEQLLLELAEARAQPQTREPWLETVLARLGEADTFAPDYARLASEVGMGLSTLRRRFKGATGLPLHGYVLQTRLAAARTLLGETDLPVKAVAERLGYDNVFFFSRQFRRGIGVPPAVYRRSRQA